MTLTPAKPDLANFLSNMSPTRGNSPWANEFAQTLVDVVVSAAQRAPRSQQIHLGPSELGAACDRQVVAKMSGKVAKSISDPWPSVVGTSVHAWLANSFSMDDRWLAEYGLTPLDGLPGTADLYDRQTHTVIDHKILGTTTMAELRASGPSRLYLVQLALYGLGFLRAGWPVERIAIAAWPRQGSRVEDLYVWEHAMDEEIRDLLNEVIKQTQLRTLLAQRVVEGAVELTDVPATPGKDCFYCPLRDCDRRDR